MNAKPVALVTGANKGIGLQIAKDLASYGFTVLVGSRDLAKGEVAAKSVADDARAIIKVNSADPGFTATDLNNHQGTGTVEEGAREAVRLALLGPTGPTGTFSNSGGPVAW